jgi:ABC-type multidrug transport system fused ATPase/permease subunit
MIAAAVGATGAEIAIALLTKSVIDGAIEHHQRGLLIPLGLAAITLGAATAALNLIRRWVQGNAVASMEKTIRDDLYAHLQRLDPAFHDGWQSGQLLSRATTDLSSIRRFAGFGIVFLFISILTFAAVIVLLIRLNWWLGLITGGMFAPVLIFCTRFERRYKVLSRRVQDQEGDLATLIEEAASGVRVLKALGRAPEAAARHEAQATDELHQRKTPSMPTSQPHVTDTADSAKLPKARYRPPASPTPEAVAKVITAAREIDPALAVYLRLASVTGTRRGELCGLQWADLHLDAGVVHIAWSYLLRDGSGLCHYADPVSEVDRRAAAYLAQLTAPISSPDPAVTASQR